MASGRTATHTGLTGVRRHMPQAHTTRIVSGDDSGTQPISDEITVTSSASTELDPGSEDLFTVQSDSRQGGCNLGVLTEIQQIGIIGVELSSEDRQQDSDHT